MLTHVGEAIVLRSWPFQESDLLITLFTRGQGKVRGVAKAAMKSRRRFGGALEPTTHVRAHYVEKPRQDLMRMDSFEILSSPLNECVNYARASALAFVTELLDDVLPDHDPQDALFRLTLAVLAELRSEAPLELPLAYFALWCTRLQGWLPELHRCMECGVTLSNGGWSTPARDGLFCVEHRRPQARPVGVAALALAEEMLRLPLAKVLSGYGSEGAAHRAAAAIELRRFTLASLERHTERRLATRAAVDRAIRTWAAPAAIAG